MRSWLREHFNESEAKILETFPVEEVEKIWNKKEFQEFLKSRGVSGEMGICDQEEGDLVYIPSYYGHATLNMDESIGMAFEFDRGDC